jgi:hypothetical protein
MKQKTTGKIILFMNIKDKIIISKKRRCPAHTFPHKLPFGEKIIGEPCHIHKKTWRAAHHKLFCKILNCPHYHFMSKKSAK